MKQKTNKLRVAACLVAVAMVCIIGAQLAHAQSTIRVRLGPVVIDVCPNILGVQTSVPPGMVIDEAGNCVTPPPPLVDVCNNIEGYQASIPEGFYRDANGDCFRQPSPPVDVCPNITGLQSTVPNGLVVDQHGNCVAPPVDECPNIDGPQSTIPQGMTKSNGICFTPITEPSTSLPPPSGGSTSRSGTVPRTAPDYKNVPDVLDPVMEPLVNLVPESIKKIVKAVPKEVAQTVPYYIFGLLGLAAVVLAVQALREVTSTRILMALIKKERSLAEQKDNFIALASHYLRTPLTLMQNGLDTIIALKEVGAPAVKPLQQTLREMDGHIKSILASIENNDALKHITAPRTAPERLRIFRSAFFWGPVAGSVIFSLLANFLLGVVADVDLGTANLLFQVVVIIAVSMLFYSAVRNFYIHKLRRRKQQQLLDYERTVDEARNGFIAQTTAVLSDGLGSIYANRHLLGKAPSAKFFDEGYVRFNAMLEKFLLLGQLRSDRLSTVTTINLHDIVDQVLSSYAKQLKEKSLTAANTIDTSITTRQNPVLFEFIIRSLIDNAIKFNTSNGTIRIDANKETRQFAVSVSDSGIGIPKDKLSQVFQPFSRATSAMQFDYEGLGFSLFLDRIITDYIGGSIAAASSKDHGTSVTVRATPTRA